MYNFLFFFLGRSPNLGEFVRLGQEVAEIEIELLRSKWELFLPFVFTDSFQNMNFKFHAYTFKLLFSYG